MPTIKHGMSYSPEYRAWLDMKHRCKNPASQKWKRYGGRGIFVCAEWDKSFEQFYADMGPRPSPNHSIERINNNDGYHPKNCCWALPIDQANNQKRNRIVIYRDKIMTAAQACRAAGSIVSLTAVLCRLRRGWSVAQAVETPTLAPVRRYRAPLTLDERIIILTSAARNKDIAAQMGISESAVSKIRSRYTFYPSNTGDPTHGFVTRKTH